MWEHYNQSEGDREGVVLYHLCGAQQSSPNSIGEKNNIEPFEKFISVIQLFMTPTLKVNKQYTQLDRKQFK